MGGYYDLSRIEALQDVMGSDTQTIVRALLGSITAAIERIETARSAGRLDQVIQPAHAARNDVLMLGATHLQEALTDLEAAARAGDETGAQVAFERLQQVWPPTRDGLRALAG